MQTRTLSLIVVAAALVAGALAGLAGGAQSEAQEADTLPAEARLFPGTNHVAYGLLVDGVAIPELVEQPEMPVEFTDALPPGHTVEAVGRFSNGDYEGNCTVPPDPGFTDAFEITVEGDTLTIFQPSTGDLGVGTINTDGTFRTENVNGEIYEGTWGEDWSLWGINIYPVSQFCNYIWEVHIEPVG